MAPGVPATCEICGAPLPESGTCVRCNTQVRAIDPAPRGERVDALPPIRVGDVLEGKWRIENVLGEGGMGAVFLAHDLALDRKVAVKVLARALCADQAFVARFEREARLTAQLEHPNVVPVYAVGRHNGRPFMVMKKLEGETLAFHLQAEGRFAPEVVLGLLAQLCAGLTHIHAHGCVHRDIKSGNVFISPTGHATILDFGVLRDNASTGATTGGMVIGTPIYMSPEQARGSREIDHRADLYALGVLMFECLVGRPPFEADSVVDIILKHASEPPPDIGQVDPALSAALGAVLKKALAKAPEDRFQSADEFLAAFQAAVYAAPAAPVVEASQAPAAPAPPAVPDPQEFDPTSLPNVAPASVAEPSAAGEAGGRRWLWPVLAVLALGVGAGEFVYLKWGDALRARIGSTAPAAPPAAPSAPAAPLPESLAAPETKRGADKGEKPSGPAVAKGSAILRINSMLSGRPFPATVEVDGVSRGQTPVSLELPQMKHKVRVTRAGFQPYEEDIVLTSKGINLTVDLVP